VRFNVPRRCWHGARELLELAAVGGGTRGGDTAACARIGLLARALAFDGDRIDPVAKAKRPRMSGASPGVYAGRLAQVRASAASVLARSRAVCVASSVAVSATVAAAVARSMAEAMPPVTDTNWRRTNVWQIGSFKKKPPPKLTLQIAKTRWNKHATMRVHQARPRCAAPPLGAAPGERRAIVIASYAAESSPVSVPAARRSAQPGPVVSTERSTKPHRSGPACPRGESGAVSQRRRPPPVARRWRRQPGIAQLILPGSGSAPPGHAAVRIFLPRVMHACINHKLCQRRVEPAASVHYRKTHERPAFDRPYR